MPDNDDKKVNHNFKHRIHTYVPVSRRNLRIGSSAVVDGRLAKSERLLNEFLSILRALLMHGGKVRFERFVGTIGLGCGALVDTSNRICAADVTVVNSIMNMMTKACEASMHLRCPTVVSFLCIGERRKLPTNEGNVISSALCYNV